MYNSDENKKIICLRTNSRDDVKKNHTRVNFEKFSKEKNPFIGFIKNF